MFAALLATASVSLPEGHEADQPKGLAIELLYIPVCGVPTLQKGRHCHKRELCDTNQQQVYHNGQQPTSPR